MNGSVTYEGALLSGNISINAGGNLEELEVTENGIYTPDQGVDGFNKVTVDVPAYVPVIQSKSITENGTYIAPDGVDGFSPIVVDVPAYVPVIQSKSITENGTYTAPEGVDGFSPITVNVPTGIFITVNGDGLQVSTSSDYSSASFTTNLTTNRWYVISIYDSYGAVYNYALLKYTSSGQQITAPLYDGNMTLVVTDSTISGYSYGGNFRDIYCKVCELPDNFRVTIPT